MNPTHDQLLNIGVLGLGRGWRRKWKPALERASAAYRVCVLYDAVDRVTQEEAQLQRCRAADSLEHFLNHPELDVILFCDPTWFRLWPLLAACRSGQPVLSALPLSCDIEDGQALIDAMSAASRAVHWVHALAESPTLQHFQEEVSRLGPVHFISAQVRVAPDEDRMACLCILFEGCMPLFPCWPTHVQAIGPRSFDAPIGSGVVVYGPDWEAHITTLMVPEHMKSGNRLEVLAERGQGELQWPDVYVIKRPGESRKRTLVQEDDAAMILRQFHQMVWQGDVDQLNQKFSIEAFHLLHAAWRSAEDMGRRIETPPMPVATPGEAVITPT